MSKIHSSADGEGSEQQPEQQQTPVQEMPKNTQTKKQPEEKRILGMKPKVALWVGIGILALGVGAYFYFKSKKKALPITE